MNSRGGGARRVVRTPFQLTSLGDLSKQSASSRVECLVVSVHSGGAVANIYVGTSDGQVLLFNLPLEGDDSGRAGSPPSSLAPSLSSPSTPQSLSSVNSVEETRSPASLIASHKLGKTPVDSLCDLPAANQIAALCEGHVTLLGKKGLDAPVHMAAVKGGVLLACDLTQAEGGEDLGWLSSLPGNDPEGGELARKALKVQRRKGLQRLFGAKQRVSDARTDTSSDDSRQDPIELQKLQRVVVATRWKLLIFGVPTERDSEHPVILLREVASPDAVLSLVWYGRRMVLGTQKGYLLLDLQKGGKSSPLFSLPNDSSRPPLMKLLTVDASELLLFADNLGIVVDSRGQPTGASYLLKAPPDTVGHTHKYLLAVAEGQLDILLRKGGVFVQSLALGGKKGGVLGPSIAADDTEGRCTVIAANAKLWYVQPTPLEEQAKELLRQREIDEGVALIEEASTSSPNSLASSLLPTVHAEAGFIQFNELHFEFAIDHFLRSSAFEPAELFPFFPTYTASWRSIVPRKRYWGLHPPPQALKKVVDNGLFQQQNGIGQLTIGTEAESSPEKYVEEAKRSVARYLATVRRKDSRSNQESLHEKARQGVSLLTLNERSSKGVNSQSVNKLEAQGIDTLLVRLYADVSEVRALEALASAPHACALGEVEGSLREKGRFHALALLLESAGDLGRALEVWEGLVSGKIQESEAADGEIAEEKARASVEDTVLKDTVEDQSQQQESESHLGEIWEQALAEESDHEGPRLLSRVASLSTREYGSFRSSSFRSSLGAESGLLSPRRPSSEQKGVPLKSRSKGQAAVGALSAARVLKRTAEMSLILEHGRWLVRLEPELALAAFTSEEREAPLPADRVLALLREEDASIWRRYLHWVVEEQGTQDGRLHTELAIALAQAALDKMTKQSEGFREGLTENSGASTSGFSAEKPSKRSVQSIAETGTVEPNESLEAGESRVEIVPDGKSTAENAGTVLDVRRQLQAFLDESDKYDIGGVLDKIKGSELWREQVILYRRGGDHVSALKVLALKLGDIGGAEQYCALHGGLESYSHLLDMYLSPGDGRTPMHAAAVRLLHCHGASLDPLKVLEALPSDMPLAAAADTLARILRERVHRRRQGQIVHHLTRKENFDVRFAKVQERSRFVELNDERACWACHAPIGTKLCALYPNNVLVCYKCLRKSGEHVCPVTGTDFRIASKEG